MIKSGFKYLTQTKQSLQMQITALETELQNFFLQLWLNSKDGN